MANQFRWLRCGRGLFEQQSRTPHYRENPSCGQPVLRLEDLYGRTAAAASPNSKTTMHTTVKTVHTTNQFCGSGTCTAGRSSGNNALRAARLT